MKQESSTTDLMRTPLHAHHKTDHPRRTQQPPDIVNLPQHFLLIHNLIPCWILVHEQHQHQTNKIPEADRDPDVSPVGRLRDELRPKHGGAEGQNSEDDKADVGAALADRDQFGRACEGDEFIQARAEAGEDHPAYFVLVSENANVGEEV